MKFWTQLSLSITQNLTAEQILTRAGVKCLSLRKIGASFLSTTRMCLQMHAGTLVEESIFKNTLCKHRLSTEQTAYTKEPG